MVLVMEVVKWCNRGGGGSGGFGGPPWRSGFVIVVVVTQSLLNLKMMGVNCDHGHNVPVTISPKAFSSPASSLGK